MNQHPLFSVLIGIALILAVGSSAAQEAPLLFPPPDGETLESVMDAVLATERREVRSGPPYIVVREKSGASPVPILSVYKKILGIGYFHLPPAEIQEEICAAPDGARCTSESDGLFSDREFMRALVVLTFGHAVITDLLLPGSGDEILSGGRDIILDIHENDMRDYRDMMNADDDFRAHTDALHSLVTDADRFGMTRLDGEDYWYVSAGDLNLRQSPTLQGAAFTGTAIVDRIELWIEKASDRIARLRFTGHGSNDAQYTFPLEPFDLAMVDEGTSQVTGVNVPMGPFTIEQRRRDFRTVAGSEFAIPFQKASVVRFEPKPGDHGGEVLELMQHLARNRNEAAEQARNGEISREEWQRWNDGLEEALVQLEAAYELATEPLEGGIVVVVECTVPAESIATVVANITTLTRAVLDPSECS